MNQNTAEDQQNQQSNKAFAELVNTMQRVNILSEEAKLSETSFSGNNGGRIEFNEDKKPFNTLLKQ